MIHYQLQLHPNGSAFAGYVTRWNLIPDGRPITTRTSDLLPVLYKGIPAILKIAREPEERWGGPLMVWWDGEGAARVLAHEGDALVLERAVGQRSLDEMAQSGHDDEASRIICDVAAKLHAPRPQPAPELIPLTHWFAELEPAALRMGGVLRQSLDASRGLLREPQSVGVLHGDLHHGNILDGGMRGWLAIDPKRLLGERAFDFANIFCNPDLETASAPGRLARQATVVALAAGLDRRRLLRWILAYAGLSAAWSMGTSDEDPDLALLIAELAAAELTKS